MDFTSPLTRWNFDRREKRFFIYGKEPGQVAHCVNTGSMRGILTCCKHLWVHDHGENTPRKLRYTAELAELDSGVLVSINTLRANALAAEAIRGGMIPELVDCADMRAEAVWGKGVRFDLCVSNCWIEVKNVTLAEPTTGGMTAMFPDAVTERGKKHLEVLAGVAASGGKALQLYIVPRADVVRITPADAIDPAYGAALRAAVKAGVQVVAMGCRVSPQGIQVDKRLPVVL